MSSRRILSVVLASLVLTLTGSSSSQAEDLGLFIGSIKDSGLVASTRANSFFTAIPGGRFVITVAHVAPSPEDSIVRGVPSICESVRFRVDTLVVQAADGSIEIELGDEQSLAPGQSSRIVRAVDPSSGAGLPTYQLDQLGFRIRAAKASPSCGIVASGLFFADDRTLTPMPIAVIPDLGPSPKLSSDRGR